MHLGRYLDETEIRTSESGTMAVPWMIRKKEDQGTEGGSAFRLRSQLFRIIIQAESMRIFRSRSE